MACRGSYGFAGGARRIFEGCRQYLLLIANQQVDAALGVKKAPSDLVQDTCSEHTRVSSNFAAERGKSCSAAAAHLAQCRHPTPTGNIAVGQAVG